MLLARIAALALLAAPAAGIRHDADASLAIAQQQAVASAAAGQAAAAGQVTGASNLESFPKTWPSKAKAAAAAMMGMWHDAQDRGFLFDRDGDQDTIGIHGLADDEVARFQLSNATYFQGRVGKKMMRFSTHPSRFGRCKLVVEQFEKSGREAHWTPLPVGHFWRRAPEFDPKNFTTLPFVATYSEAESELARSLLGTWRSLVPTNPLASRMRSHRLPQSIKFEAEGREDLVVDIDGQFGPLRPASAMFEGSYREGGHQVLTRFTLGPGGRSLVGERKNMNARTPTWQVSFRLARDPLNEDLSLDDEYFDLGDSPLIGGSPLKTEWENVELEDDYRSEARVRASGAVATVLAHALVAWFLSF